MAQITFCKSLKPAVTMLHNSPWQIAGEPHIQHSATVRDEIDIEHLLCKSLLIPQLVSLHPFHYFPVLTSHNPKPRHFDRRRRTCRRSGEICFCSCLFSSHTLKSRHFDRRRRTCRRSGEICCLLLFVFLPPPEHHQFNPMQIHFGSGSGSTVLIPGNIVEVALNFR